MSKILIIDDEEDILFTCQRILKREGYDVEATTDGGKGIKMFQSNPADLIITDIIMPEKEGIELIRELKNDYPHVKIIAISGGSPDSGNYLNFAKKFGAMRVLQKPFNHTELLAIIKECLKS